MTHRSVFFRDIASIGIGFASFLLLPLVTHAATVNVVIPPVTMTPAYIEFAGATSTVAEGSTGQLPPVLVRGTVTATSTFELVVTGGSAMNGADFLSGQTNIYSVAPGIYDGATSSSIILASSSPSISNDLLVEGDENVIFGIQALTGSIQLGDTNGDSATTSAHVMTISDRTPGMPLAGAWAGCSAFVTGFASEGAVNEPAQIMRIQVVLNEDGFAAPISGTYDELTADLVMAFQYKHADEVLAPWGLTEPTRNVYLTTRKVMNEVHCRRSVSFPLTANEQSIVQGSLSISAIPAFAVHQPGAGRAAVGVKHANPEKGSPALTAAAAAATTSPLGKGPLSSRYPWILALIVIAAAAWGYYTWLRP